MTPEQAEFVEILSKVLNEQLYIFDQKMEAKIAANIDMAFKDSCNCPLKNSPDQAHIPRIVNMIGDVGDGSVVKGTNNIRENHSFVLELREGTKRYKNTILGTLITTITTSICALFLSLRSW